MELVRRQIVNPYWWTVALNKLHGVHNVQCQDERDDGQSPSTPSAPTAVHRPVIMIHPDPSYVTSSRHVNLPAVRPAVLELATFNVPIPVDLSSPSTLAALMPMSTPTSVLDLSSPSTITALINGTPIATTTTSTSNIGLAANQFTAPVLLTPHVQTEPIVITPNTEYRLITTLTEAITSHGLTAATPTGPSNSTTESLPLVVTHLKADDEDAKVPEESARVVRWSVDTMDSSTMDKSDTSSVIGSTVDSLEVGIIGPMDPAVAKAAEDAACQGTLTPLIKTELKYTIQNKRIMQGKEEVTQEELMCKETKNEELTPADKARRGRRRERNKLAAQRCRTKRKTKADELEQESQCLESANKKLRFEIEALEKEKANLKRIMLFHDDRNCKCPKRVKLSESDDMMDEDLLNIDEDLDISEEQIQIVMKDSKI